MKEDAPTTHQEVQAYEGQSRTYIPPSASTSTTPKGIIKSKPKMDKLVIKIWQQKPESEAFHLTTTLDDTSIDDSPVQPAGKKIKLVFLDSTGEQESGQSNGQAPVKTPNDNIEEEHDPAPNSPANSSISSLHASNF